VTNYLDAHTLSRAHEKLAIKHLWDIGCATGWYGTPEAYGAPELLLRVPTYHGAVVAGGSGDPQREDFDEPYAPVLVRDADGVRILLGSHDDADVDRPDVQIERRPRGWAIFLHPVGGSDPSGYVYFLDDGRSYLLPEGGWGPTPAIQVLPRDSEFHAIDQDPDDSGANNESYIAADGPEGAGVHPVDEQDPGERCGLCDCTLAEGGDNWDGLCPECADLVSEMLDARGGSDEDRDELVARLEGVVARARNAERSD
jgi:hypothetical protein